MKSNLKLASDVPPRSPERERLAEKIADLAAAKQRAAAIKAAIITAGQAVSTAFATVEEATAGIEKAKVAVATFLTEVALGTAGDPPMSVQAARQAAQNAQDNLDAARAALDQLKKQEMSVVNTPIYVEMAVKDLIVDVIKAELPVDQLLAEFATIQRDYIMRRRALEWLESKGAIKLPSGEPREWAAAARAPWDTCMAALATDADAVLPV